MKRIILFLILISVLHPLQSFAEETKQKTKLVIKFSGMTSSNGNIKVAICNSEQNYKDHRSPFIGKDVPIKNNIAVVEIEDLPSGEYAVKAFHDEDANDDLNTNFLGIPIEDYGFSNNARGIFGPPSWNEAKFNLSTETRVIEIIIK